MTDQRREGEEMTAFTIRRIRNEIIEECANAARDGFEKAMGKYVLIGPSGMAMQMINYIKELKT